MLLEILLVIPGLFHLVSGQGERTSVQSATPDPLEELFGIGLDKNIDPWSSNLIFGDIQQNEFSNSVVTTPPPLPRNNNRERSRQESLPAGLSFLNGGGSLPGFPVLDAIPPPVDQASTGENGLLNIPPMPNFDQLGLENVLDKFLPIDGSFRLPPPSDNPIIHSRENSPIPSIGQLGIDSNGLFGESLFSPSAGSLSNTPAASTRSTENLSTVTNNNNNNNQMGLIDIPSETTSLNQGNLAQNLATLPTEKSTEEKAIDHSIWDGILPPIPKDRNPVEVLPTNKPTQKPKISDGNPKKKKALLPLLPPTLTRKSTKNKSKRISSNRILDTIPRVNQLITTTTPRPKNINNKNLLANIPSIDQLGIFGSSSPTENTILSDNAPKTTEQTSIIGDIFQFPDQFNGGNRQSSSVNKDRPKDSMPTSQTQASDTFSTDSPKNATTLEEIWKNILIEIPELGKLTGEETPKDKPKSIDELLGFSVHDIESFDANQSNTLQPDETKPRTILKTTTPKPFPVFLRTTPRTVYVPTTTLPPRIFITPSVTPLPPLKVNTPIITTTPATPPPLPPLILYTTTSTIPPPPPPTTSTPKPPTTIGKDIYSLPIIPTIPPKVYVPPTLASPEKIATPQKHITIDFKKKDQNIFESPGFKIKDEGALPPLSGELLPTLGLPELTDFSITVSTTNSPPLELPSESASSLTTPFSINNFVPTIPDEQFKRPDIIDMGIFNDNKERSPFTQVISEEPWLPKVKENNIPESFIGEQGNQKQSQVFDWDVLFPDTQKSVFDNVLNEKENQKSADIFSKTEEKFKPIEFTDGKESTTNLKSFIPKTTEETPLLGLEMLMEKNTEHSMPTTTSIPELPPLDFDLLGSLTKDQKESKATVNEDRSKITIEHQNIKDFPPLDIDILQGFQDVKEAATTPSPPTPTLPSLPFFGDLNTMNTGRQQPWDTTPRAEIFSARDTSFFTTLPPFTRNEEPENAGTISRSPERTNDLPFIGPTSEASKHFDFEPHSGGNIRPHPILLSQTTTQRTPITKEKTNKPNILVIDIVKKPSEEIDTTTRRSSPVFQNANNLVNIPQVTPTPQKGTTPAWLMSTLIAIRARLNQLRALRNNRQNTGNNNSQNPVINTPTNQNTNQRQVFTLPSQLDLNIQRNNGPLIQNQQPQLQNGNVRNLNIQRPGANGVLFQGNPNNLPFSNSGISQNQPLANFRNLMSQNAQQQGRRQFQMPNIPNRSNQPNLQVRQSVFQPSVDLRQTQTPRIQNIQTQQSGATEAETELLRERVRQRIQQVLRTQILRQLLVRRLQALRSQTNNNAQPAANQPIRRIPTSTNNMNIMSANNAINIIRQARQRALAASQQQQQLQQQQQQQQQQWPGQQFNNILRRFSNRNLQNVGFTPNSFGRQQTTQPLDFSRLFQNNRGLNFNNRLAQSIQRMVSNETNGNRMRREQGLDLSQPPSERALQTLRNFNLQRTRGLQPGTTSNVRNNQNLKVERRAIPISEAFQVTERLRAQNRDIAPFRNLNPNIIPQSVMERLRNGLRRFQPVQNVLNTRFNRQRIIVPINGQLLGQRNNLNVSRRPNLGQTSPPPQFNGPQEGWPWVAENSDK